VKGEFVTVELGGGVGGGEEDGRTAQKPKVERKTGTFPVRRPFRFKQEKGLGAKK